MPWQLVVSRPAFARAAHGIRPPGGVYCHVAGCDLVRDGDGAWKVLEDNVRTPSRHLLRAREPARDDAPAARRCSSTTASGPSTTTRRCSDRPGGGRADRRGGGGDGRRLDPGPYNSAYFEHAFLARQMGVELVEATDLVVRDAVCHIRTTRGLQRVHAIYRRIDDDFMDPLEFRPDSVLGVPGLMRAYRAGSVAIVNAVGTGVADDKAIYHYVPEMIRYYLGEEPIIANVPTYLMSDREQREWVLERLDQVVVKPTERIRRQGRVHRAGRDRARSSAAQAAEIKRVPERWIAQDLVHLSTVPTAGPDGTLAAAPRRPAAVRGLRRRHPDRPRRAHPRGAARGLDDRQLLPGRRLEGHVGARGGRRRAEPRRAADRVGAAEDARPAARRQLVHPATAAAAVDARPDRPRALLDRPPARARRAHVADARRRLPRRPPGPPGRPRGRAAVAGTRC